MGTHRAAFFRAISLAAAHREAPSGVFDNRRSSSVRLRRRQTSNTVRCQQLSAANPRRKWHTRATTRGQHADTPRQTS